MAGPIVSLSSGCSHWKQWWRSPNTCCSKKILLLLVWEVLFTFSFEILVQNHGLILDNDFISIMKFLSMLLAPLVGLLADMKFGRYKIIKTGSFVSFFASLFYFVALVSPLLKSLLFSVAMILFCVSVACYSAALLPFLTDQIIGATSNELNAAVHWYYWAKQLGFGLCDITFYLMIDKGGIKFEAVLFFAVPLAVIIISDCLCQQWLDRTHKVTNPIKLIIQVLNYTRKHRYPERRSAFTYIDEEQPTRMDNGKKKFGGPFTEEEVEDVKTVLRLIPLVVCFSLFVITVAFSPVAIVAGKGDISSLVNFGLKNWLFPLMLIPFYQFLRQCGCSFSPSMLRCIGAGVILCTLGYALLSASEVVGVALSHEMHRYLSCSSVNTTELDHIVPWYWKICPLLLYSTGKTIVSVLVLEFIIAQSPDKMKGFVLGILLAFHGIVYLILAEASRLQFSLCYDLQALVILFVLFVVFLVLSKCYTLRERNREVNIQAIVEEHYERYMNQEEEYMRDDLRSIEIINSY